MPAVAGPKRPQDRIAVPELKNRFETLFENPIAEGGFGLNPPPSMKAIPSSSMKKVLWNLPNT